jgi:hypothetical protein
MTTLEQPSGTTGSVHMRGALDIYAASTVRERLVALVQQQPLQQGLQSAADPLISPRDRVQTSGATSNPAHRISQCLF